MHESVASDSSPMAWDLRNTVQVALPAARDKAKRAIRTWKANGRPDPMMVPVRSGLPRWLLRLIPGSDEGNLLEVAYLGEVFVQDEKFYIAVDEDNQLVFSTIPPFRNMFHFVSRLEDFQRHVPKELHVQFIERVCNLLDEYIIQHERRLP